MTTNHRRVIPESPAAVMDIYITIIDPPRTSDLARRHFTTGDTDGSSER